MDQQNNIELLKEKNWALMDIEYIQTSKSHQCVRKLYILVANGYDNLELDLYPCVRYKDLATKYQQSFRFCKRKVHKLTYNPRQYSPPCSTALSKINEFIVYNNIDLILYKGGTIEKDLCGELCIPSMNIECFSELEKAQSHDSRIEVNYYYDQLVDYLFLNNIFIIHG